MVMRAGSPGMSGMMDVSFKRILVPVTEQGFASDNTTANIETRTKD